MNSPSRLPGGTAYASPWLHAHYDKLASIRTGAQGVALLDLEGMGEHAFLCADYDAKLRVFQGTRQSSEHPLVDAPAAVCGFYMDERRPRVPAVGIASGAHVFVYRNLRPFVRWTAPAVELDEQEAAVWRQVAAGEVDAATARSLLRAAHDSGVHLSPRSLAALPMDDSEQLTAHIIRCTLVPLRHDTVVTCLSALPKAVDEPEALSSLIVGTESKLLLVLDPAATAVLARVALPATPALLRCSGSFDVDWRIVIACRDARVYTVGPGERRGTAVLRRPYLELEAPVCGLVTVDRHIYVSTADAHVHCYLAKGRRVCALRMPAAVTNLELFVVRGPCAAHIVLVALASGEIRGYRDQALVDVLRVGEPIVALACGAYGRQDNALVAVTRSGALLVKMLPRIAALKAASRACGPPLEQDVPLNIPKKTRMYVEQTDRELELAPQIHRMFQNGVVRLQVAAARAYLELLDRGKVTEGTRTLATGTDIDTIAHTVSVWATVRGLGPQFHVVVELRAAGNVALLNVPILVIYDAAVYRAPRALAIVPCLLPGVTICVVIEIERIYTDAEDETIGILVLQPEPPSTGPGKLESDTSDAPLISSTLTMPKTNLS